MLIELSCEEFFETPIYFEEGLNVILGDNQGANSIGKSTLLLIIDFIFGGSTLLSPSNGTIKNLGDLSFNFCLSFNNQKYYFCRETNDQDIIHGCDDNYRKLQAINYADYTAFLKLQYGLENINLSFRQIVSLVSRIWGKQNLNAERPLNIVPSEKSTICINRLIEYFQMYKSIELLETDLNTRTDEKNNLSKAFKSQVVQKINKTTYNSNENNIENIYLRIRTIKEELAKDMCSINEILNEKIIKLKIKKDDLLNSKMSISNKIERISKNIKGIYHGQFQEIQKLNDFFPGINKERLEAIENFHSGISNILSEELTRSKQSLVVELKAVEEKINQINIQIDHTILSVKNPSPIIDEVFNIATDVEKMRKENIFYEKNQKILNELKEIKKELVTQKEKITKGIEIAINRKLRELVTEIYQESRQSPVIKIDPTQYSYNTVDDTGTGKYFSNLVLFDLSLFELTTIPLIIHDSILFKNIEISAVAELIKIYNKFKKQIFISIDEVTKYDCPTIEILLSNAAIQLTDEKLLFKKDWRSQK